MDSFKFPIALTLIILLIFMHQLSWGKDRKTVRINTCSFQAELADTMELRQQGLSGRKQLADNAAMLFVFAQNGYHGFWMKDMNFSLDLIWIKEGTIVDITADVPPAVGDESKWPRYFPKRKADQVLEIKAGTAKKCGMKIGDWVYE
ncbi:MAG: DUF192 domain-containing protein [Candidatus Schekmanbacteria bacterium]|nr:DUF192 domain-containing protein [Candidatus Schekmanbacteria bacterium]